MKTICLELGETPEYDAQLIYQMVSDMFDVEIRFDETEIEVSGLSRNVAAWIAFHLLPMEVGLA